MVETAKEHPQKENLSINDPNVHPRLIHKDGTICRSKMYWASINRKPPLKEFELPDLFSDNEDLETEKNSSETLSTHTGKTLVNTENKSIMVNTEKTTIDTPGKSEETHASTENSTPSKEASSTNEPSVNSEKTGEKEATETERTPLECGMDNSITTDTVNVENNITDLENKIIDNGINKQTQIEAPVNAENNVDMEPSILDNVNIVNINTETDNEVTTETNKSPNINNLPIQGQDRINVNTQKTTPDQAQPTNNTPKTSNQKNIKKDWSSLMFSSDDSLFDEMTKQLEDDTIRPEINKKSPRKSPTSTITTASTSTQDQETLPDIVYTGKRTDTVTGLLMLGADPKRPGCRN